MRFFHHLLYQSITPFLTTLTFHVCFLSIYEFKVTSFLIPGDSYKFLQRQKIQARRNRTMARTKANNHGVKIKDKETKRSTCHDNPAIIFIANFPVDCPTEFPLITALLELSAPLIRSTFIQIQFYRYFFWHAFFISNAFFQLSLSVS